MKNNISIDKSFPIELHTEEVQEIVSHIPNWIIRSGTSLILLIFIALMIICCFVEYPDLIKADVIITTTPSPIPLVTRTSGNIVLLKNDHSLVKKGEVIAYIASTANFHHVQKLEGMLNASENEFTEHFILGDIQPYYAAFINSLAAKRHLFETDIFTKQISHQRKLVANYQKLNKTLNIQYKLFREELAIAGAKFKRDSVLFSQKVIAPVNYEEALSSYLQQKRAFENSEASITNNDIQINLLEKQIMEIDVQKIEQENKVKQEYNHALRELLAQIAKWKEKYLITTSSDGNIAYLGFYENEGFIDVGKHIFSVIPIKGKIHALAELPLEGSGKVKPGQQVNIRLENYPHEQFGMLLGTVKEISVLPAEGKYLVKIEVDRTLTTTYKKRLLLKHQLKGKTEIITEDLLLIQRIFYQFRALLNVQKL